MTVINPNSISGITSITMPSGDGNVLTIHTNDGTERFRIDSSGNVKVGSACTISQDGDVFFTGVCTATTLAGSGANLTALPAGNLTGALPAISGANLTGIAATDNVRTGILDVAGIATFRNNVNVGTAVTITESGIEATGVGITVANINNGQIAGRRNMLINGAMIVNQREQTGTLGYYNPVTSSIYTLDRWKISLGGGFDTDSAKIYHSTTAPSQHGFAYSLKVDIGNTETPSSGQRANIGQRIEGSNLQGLAYGTSNAKTMTLSFWVRSNKTGIYSVQLVHESKYVLYEYTINSTNTWEKKTITIVGNTADVTPNDNTVGLYVDWFLCANSDVTASATSSWTSGTSYRASTNQVNLWDDGSNEWYLTGCQLEIGTTATEFEHQTYQEVAQLCYRYYYRTKPGNGAYFGSGFWYNSSSFLVHVDFPVVMRTNVTALEQNGTADNYKAISNATTYTCNSVPTYLGDADNTSQSVNFHFNSSGTQGQGGLARSGNSTAYLGWDAEL